MDAKWLNDQFSKFPDKSKSELSDLLDTQPSAISKMLAGTRQIKAREYMLMRKFFDMPVSGQSLSRKASSIQSYANLGAEDSAHQNWTSSSQSPRYQVIEVSDASMVPDFIPGERVLIDATSKINERSGIFAIEDQGRIQIRILEQNSASKIKILSLAKDVPSKIVIAAKLHILGRVVAKLNWL